MKQKSKIALVRLEKGFGDTTPAIKYNLEDHLGNSTILLETSGSLVNKEEYYPFGETSFGSYGKKRYKFSGKECDEESGLYYCKYRYHSAWTCRFISVDPLAPKYPFYCSYSYCGNMVITHREIEGLEPDTESNVEFGATLNYSQGGGLTFGLYTGLSFQGNIGDVGGMPALNITGTASYRGLGTSPQSKSLFTLTATPSLTIGAMEGDPMNLNLFTSQSGSGVSNPFNFSYTYGHNYILSSGMNSDGSGRSQAIGAAAIRIGGFQVASYNDTRKFPFFSPIESDQFFSAGLNANFKSGNLTLNYSFDLYYGMSNQGATYNDDRIINGQNYDNQNVYDMMFNNGIERLSVIDSNFGILQMGSRTGYQSFWPSNAMHDSMNAGPTSVVDNPTFHHLYVPYESGSYKPSMSRLMNYSNGQTVDPFSGFSQYESIMFRKLF